MRIVVQMVVLVALIGGTGCSSASKTPRQPPTTPAALKASGAGSDRLINPIKNPRGFTDTNMVRAAVMPLGAVPYDNTVLPLVSPDGKLVATQTGVPPSWDAVLADPECERPGLTRVEIHQLDRRETIDPQERTNPALLATVNEPVLLGRSCDAEGFLVESLRDDGSRWIGKASWTSGEITWLVQGEAVNAFAALGPDGRLAWCRRMPGSERFELVVRTMAGESAQWTLSSQFSDYLMPTWSGRGDGLFVLNLEDGNLEFRFGAASDQVTFLQSVERFSVCTDANVHTAFQALTGQAAVPQHAGANSRHQIFYFHPALSRMAIWRPTDTRGRRAMYLNARSFSALMDEHDYALVCTQDDLLRQNLANERLSIKLVAGTQIPRRTPDSNWPYLLMRPGDGYIGLTALNILGADLPATAAAAKPAGN